MERVRERVPLIAALLLVLMALATISIACVCISTHPIQSIEQNVTAAGATASVIVPASFESWAILVASIAVVAFLGTRRRYALGRGSPPLLQRFLF